MKLGHVFQLSLFEWANEQGVCSDWPPRSEGPAGPRGREQKNDDGSDDADDDDDATRKATSTPGRHEHGAALSRRGPGG